MVPYLLWILFASYLNFYVWWYNSVAPWHALGRISKDFSIMNLE
jgi:hypothetical protein